MPLASSLEGLSYRLFGRLSPKFLNVFSGLKEDLQKAGIKIYPETYISLMFFSAFLTLPVTITTLMLLYLYKWLLLIPLVCTPAYVMMMFLIVPKTRASERAHNLEREMPFAAAYITVMATGGISPYMSIKRLANVDLMPAMRKEAKEILKDVEIFGIDPLTAISKAALSNPLDIFRDFFSGYASTVITGADVVHFLEMKTEEIFKIRSQRIKIAAERLGMLLESFVIVMVLMALCFYILFSIESIYSTGIPFYSGMILYTYIFTPLLSIVFVYLAHDMQPRTPITDWRPYKACALCSLIAAPILLLFTDFLGIAQSLTIFRFLKGIIDLPTAITISLVISTAPAAIVHSKVSRIKSGLESGIANFLRDLTEIRKTGLAPERCIESLSKRAYGEFRKELDRISSQLSLGAPLRRVFINFIQRTKSWLSQIVIFLLVETIDVGGGTIAMIEAVTRFNTMTQDVEREKRMTVRPYIFIPYFAAIMLMSTVLLVLLFIAKTITIAGTRTTNIEEVSLIFTVSVIFYVFIIGLVAGKISEESISAGFKHSAILVVVSLLAAIFIPRFVTL